MKLTVKNIYYLVAVLSSVLLFSSCSKSQSKKIIDESNSNSTNNIDSSGVINSDGNDGTHGNENNNDGASSSNNSNDDTSSGSNSDSENNSAVNNKMENQENKDTEEQDELLSDVLSEENSAEVSSSSSDTPISAPKIIVKKSERILELWDGDSLYDSYPIGLGFSPEGDKSREGDGRTPIGTYYVCTRNSNSRFYLSLGISYPNKEDASTALNEGRIDESTYNQIADAIDSQAQPPWNTPLGGEIMIHGMGSSSDWTAGCIAVDNHIMDILWTHIKLKTPVEILP